MKQLKYEIKMLIIMILLSWVIDLIPRDNAGFELLGAIIKYLETDLKKES